MTDPDQMQTPNLRTRPVDSLDPAVAAEAPVTARRAVLRIDAQPESTASRVLAQVRARPGITIQQVAHALGFSHATCTYHLQALVRNKAISRINDGRDVRFFLAGEYSVASHLGVLVADPSKLAVAQFLVEGADELPGLTINEAARRLGLPFGFLKRTLLQFERIGFVYMSRRGRRYVVCPVQQALTRDLMALLGISRRPESGGGSP